LEISGGWGRSGNIVFLGEVSISVYLAHWVYIRCCGNGCLGFRPYGEALFPDAEKVPKKACSYVRPARWGSGFLRCGIDPGAVSTVCFAAPPLAVFGFAKRSLRSHARINPSIQPSDVARGSRSRAGELILGLVSGEERVVGFGFVVDLPLTPALSRGRGSRFVGFSKLEFDSVFDVGVLQWSNFPAHPDRWKIHLSRSYS
jgi:hypothetical protein